MDAISPQDRDLAIRTIMGEEGTPEGQAGVAAVILNRLRGGYGQSLSDVVLAPGQFEPWSARTDELLSYSPSDPKYREAGRLLDALVDGKLPDPTGGATHFYAPRAQAALGRAPPAWGAGKPLATLGGTAFYAPKGAVKFDPNSATIGPSSAGGVAYSMPGDPTVRTAPDMSGVPAGALPPGGVGPEGGAPLSTKRVRTENISFPKIPSWMPKGSTWVGAPSTESIPGSEAIRPEGLQQSKPEVLHDRAPLPSGPAARPAGAGPVPTLGGTIAEGVQEMGPTGGDAQRLKSIFGEKLKEARHGYEGDVEAGRAGMAGAQGPADLLGGAARYGYGKIGEAIAVPVAGADAALQLFAEPSGAGLAPEAAGGKVDLKVNTPEVPPWMPEGSKIVQTGKEAMPVAGRDSAPQNQTVETSPPPVSEAGGAPPAVPPWMPEGSKVVSGTGPLSPLTGAQGHMYGTEPPNVDPTAKAGGPLDIRPPRMRTQIEVNGKKQVLLDGRPIVGQADDFTLMTPQQKLQGVVDDLAKRFGIEVPITVKTGEKLSGGTAGRARAEVTAKGTASQKIFSQSIEVDHTLPPEQQLAVATHEFGHVVQWNKFHQLPASEQVAIRRAWAEDVAKGASVTGPLDIEARSDFLRGQLGAPLSDAMFEVRRRLSENNPRYKPHPPPGDVLYNTTFSEWFANQVSKFLTTNREAVTVSEKFFKGIADMWRKLYETFTGRAGAVSEMEAFLRREGKFFEDQPKVAKAAERSVQRMPVRELAGAGAYATKVEPAPRLPPDVPAVIYRGYGRAEKGAAYNKMGPAVPIAGKGRYYAFDEKQAKEFGPNVERVSTADIVKNPLVITDGKQWRDLTKRAGWEFPNPFGKSEADLGRMTQRLQDLVRFEGYDGMIVKWDAKSGFDIGPKGENWKLLGDVFGNPQVIAFGEKKAGSRIFAEGETPEEEDPFEEVSSTRQPQPQPVGAGVSGVQPALPEVPTRSVITEQEDRFNRLRKSAVADKAELTNRVKEMPAEMRTPAMQEKFYRYMEDPTVPLTPQEKAFYDQYVAPLKREELALWEEAKNTDLPVEDFDPQYAHRIVKGRAPQFDALAGASEVANPIGGSRSLPKTTSSMKDRVFFAIQGFDGSRKLVAKSDDGLLRIIEKGKPAVPIKLPKDFKPGDNFFYDGQGWTVTQARTPEIEANTDLTYYKNAVANTVDNVARLRVVVRAINEVKRLLASPEWEAYAKRYDAKDVPSDWREPTMPLFRGWKVQPKLANAIDDFYGHRSNGSLIDTLAKINTWAVGSMFWSPVVHIYNVGTHWWTAKGFDLVTPRGMRSSAVDGAKALYQVVTQGPKYQELLREGSGLIYGAVANQDFYRSMMNRLGEDIKRQPAKWDIVARTIGVGPSDLARMIYGGSSRALWAASDAFMMQRVLELEGKGMSLRDAIHEAERHIPNYRVPSEVMRSRFVSQIMQNPSITEFSRYHYGMMKSYGEMAKDLFGKPKTNPLGESRRVEAIGNFMALAAMMTVVWPGMNWAIQKVTGNKDAKLGPRGAMTLAYPLVDKLMQIKWVREHAPQYLLDYYNGDADVLVTMANLVAIAPVLRTGMETIPEVQREFFSGRNVAEPSDVRAGRLPRVIGQEAEHLAKNLVQPYDALTRAARGGKGAVKAMAEQGLGISEPDRGGRAKVFRHQAQQAQQRQRKPQGPLEQVFNALGARLPPWLGGTGP